MTFLTWFCATAIGSALFLGTMRIFLGSSIMDRQARFDRQMADNQKLAGDDPLQAQPIVGPYSWQSQPSAIANKQLFSYPLQSFHGSSAAAQRAHHQMNQLLNKQMAASGVGGEVLKPPVFYELFKIRCDLDAANFCDWCRMSEACGQGLSICGRDVKT